MAISAFAVKVPEAEPCVSDLRNRYDATVALGVPAHITILVPFMAPDEITAEVLAQVEKYFATIRPFDFSLTKVARFPATAYLTPEPAQAFVAITQGLVKLFPEYPPYGGQFDSIVPHLTVANNTSEGTEIAAQELNETLKAYGPIRSRCGAITLLENSSGMWREMRSFTLTASRSTATPPGCSGSLSISTS